jgi:hypothetical protein
VCGAVPQVQRPRHDHAAHAPWPRAAHAQGFGRIENVLTSEELEGTAAAYKQIAGFDKDALNRRPPIVAAEAPVPFLRKRFT